MLATPGTNPFMSPRLGAPQNLAEVYEAMMKEAEKKKKKEKKKGGGSAANVKSIMDGIASIAKAFGAGKGGGPKSGGGAGGPSKGGGGGGPQGGGQGGCKGCGSCSQIRPQQITTDTGNNALNGTTPVEDPNKLDTGNDEEKLNASGEAEGGSEGAVDAVEGAGGGDEASVDPVADSGSDAVDTDTSVDSGPDPEPVTAE